MLNQERNLKRISLAKETRNKQTNKQRQQQQQQAKTEVKLHTLHLTIKQSIY